MIRDTNDSALWLGTYCLNTHTQHTRAMGSNLQRDHRRVRARLELGLVVKALLALLVKGLQVADRRRLGQKVRVLVLQVRNQHAELRAGVQSNVDS